MICASIIAKDEERHIMACIASARQACGFVVVLDTGSSDNTLAIARDYANLAERSMSFGPDTLPEDFDFSRARNEAKAYCAGEWLLSIDCDERLVLAGDLERFLKDAPKCVHGVLIETDEGEYVAARIVPNVPGFHWVGRVHEMPEPTGEGRMVPREVAYIVHLDPLKRKDSLERNLALLMQEPDSDMVRWHLSRTRDALRKGHQMLIVTGCPRSGTMSMAHMLGIPHERRFDLDVAIYDWWNGWWPDCAWQAAPHVEELLSRGASIVHLVRHPLDVVSSLLYNQHWLIEPGRETPYEQFAKQFIMEMPLPPEATDADKELAFWLYWNQLVEKAPNIPRIRIESIGNPLRLNHRQNIGERLTWADFTPGEHLLNAQDKAAEYGYA